MIDWFPLFLSLRVASFATVAVVVVGTGIAYLLSHREFRGRSLLETAVSLPLVLPPTVLGYYLLVVLGRESPLGAVYQSIFGHQLVFTAEAAVIAAFFHSAPIYIQAARAALSGIDHQFERAAQSLGAPEWKIFLQITLALSIKQLLSLTALTFARSLGDFGVTIMLAGNIPGRTQTLSVAIYDAVESGNGHLARILVAVVSFVALLLLWPGTYLSRSATSAGAR